ncbi:MAG: hypothetical protein H8E37_12615, partial [Planctomycetes bacterium]|nr:hypothetical protein [Planctomycetota bacterium]
MRKLTGLFIVAAVVGATWYYVSPGTSHPAAAQTGTPAAGNSAYAQTARRLMQQAVALARQGTTSQPRLQARKASRYNIQWGDGELTPNQLLAQLSGNQAPPRTINPATTRTQTLPRRAAPASVSPINSVETRRAPFDPAGRTQRDSDLPPVVADSLREVGEPAITLTGGERPTPGTTSPSFNPPRYQDTTEPFTRSLAGRNRTTTPAASRGKSRIRGRVDDYMRQAYDAWTRDDKAAAVRYASVADVLAGSVQFAAGEETPAAFLARVRSGQAPAQTGVASDMIAQEQPVENPVAPSSFPDPGSFPAEEPAVTRPSAPEIAGPTFDPVRTTPEPPTSPSFEPVAGPERMPSEPVVTTTPAVTRPPTVTPRSEEPTAAPNPLSAPGTLTTRRDPVSKPQASQLPFETPEQAQARENFNAARENFNETANARRKYALNLMQAAREELDANRLESAYEKALLASDLGVTWGLFEETPEKLAAAIKVRLNATPSMNLAGNDTSGTGIAQTGSTGTEPEPKENPAGLTEA